MLYKYYSSYFCTFFLFSLSGFAKLEFKSEDFLAWDKPGDLIEIGSKEVKIEKLLAIDCRWSRGLMINPIDGKVDSYNYNRDRFAEASYPITGGMNSYYQYLRDPGVHIQLHDNKGFNYLLIRGGFKGKMYGNVKKDDGSSGGKKIINIKSPQMKLKTTNAFYAQKLYCQYRSFRKYLKKAVYNKKISFFWNKGDWTVDGGCRTNLADVSFYRINKMASKKSYTKKMKYYIKGPIAMPESFRDAILDPGVKKGMKPRFNESPDQAYWELSKKKKQGMALYPMQYVHLFTPVLPVDTPVAAMRLNLNLTKVPKGNKLLIIVQDPLNRRSELLRASFKVLKPGKCHILLDFPDQLIPASSYTTMRIPSKIQKRGSFLISPNSDPKVKATVDETLDLLHKKDQLKHNKNIDEKRRLWSKYTNRIEKLGKELFKINQTRTINFKENPGRRFWVSILSEHGGKLNKNSSVELLLSKKKKAEIEFKQQRTMQLRGLFSMMSESRAWISMSSKFTFTQFITEHSRGKEHSRALKEIHELLLELYVRYPQDDVISQYYHWFHMSWYPQVFPSDIPEIAIPEGIPRWAILLNRANKKMTEITNWWIDQRRASNGEFGGGTNDDTCLMPWFMAPAFINSKIMSKVKDAHIGVMENAIKYELKEGLNVRPTDYGHSYEYGINKLAGMLHFNYGHPRYVEYALKTLKSFEKVVPMTAGGYRRFIPHNTRSLFGYHLLKLNIPSDPNWWKKKDNTSLSALNFHPLLIHGWYSRSTRTIKFLDEFAQGADYFRKCGGYNSGPHFAFGMYWLTGNDKYVIRDFINRRYAKPRFGIEGPGGNFAEYITHTNVTQNPLLTEAFKNSSTFREFLDEAWPATKKREDLERGLEKALWGQHNPFSMGGLEKYTYIMTEAEMYTDRIFMPTQLVSQAFLGGSYNRNNFWPSYAIHWEGLEKDYAALVLEQGKKQLKVAVINLASSIKKGAFRTWQLEHGTYKLEMGPDENDDGIMDKVNKSKTLEIMRMDTLIPVKLLPKKLTLYQLTQIKKLDSIYKRADVAISSFDFKHSQDEWQLTVHNIGNKSAEKVQITFLDKNKKELHREYINTIDAPLNLEAKIVKLKLKPIKGTTIITLNSSKTFKELTYLNNEINIEKLLSKKKRS